MPDLRKRSLAPELMDDPSVPEGEVRKALDEIEFINKWLGGYKLVLNVLDRIKLPAGVVTIMDMGSGGGDMLRKVAEWAQKKEHSVKGIGVDINPAMTRYAGNKSLQYKDIEFHTASVFDEELTVHAPDIIMCNLFAHHLDNADLVRLVRQMNNLASRTVIINDLHRHWMAYYSIKALTSMFSHTYLVKYDAPLSVARSLTRKEWKIIMKAATISNYTIRWRWAWRWEIVIEK